MRRKTQEEKRETNRLKQARWREKHAWLGEQRRLRHYGMSKQQLAVTHNAIRIEVDMPDGEVVKVWVDGHTRSGRVILALWQQLHPELSVREPPAEVEFKPGVEVEGF